MTLVGMRKIGWKQDERIGVKLEFQIVGLNNFTARFYE
jgi:hypothetical protein